MRTIKCIIVDDEPLARDVIESFVAKVPYLELVASCANAFEASDALQKNSVDLMFLDIQMPDITGLKFLETLENPPLVIFTTAYSEHALEGFEKNAIDYLLKPIAPERFLKAVSKAKELFDLKNSQPAETERDFMFIKAEYQTVKVKFEDILYIEGLKDYVKIYTKNAMLMTHLNIKGILEKLPQNQFIRIHKSYVVSIPNVEKIDRIRIVYGDKYVPIGEAYKEQFFDAIK